MSLETDITAIFDQLRNLFQSELSRRDEQIAQLEAALAASLAESDSLRVRERELEERTVQLSNEIAQLKEEIASLRQPPPPPTPPPPPPPPPIEVAPAIAITWGTQTYHPGLSYDRQGRERRYTIDIGSCRQLLLDCKDDGQVRVIVEDCDADLQTTPGQLFSARLAVELGSEVRHDATLRLHPHTRPCVVLNPSKPPSFDLSALIEAGLVPNYDPAARPSEDQLARLAIGRSPWERWTGNGAPYDPVSEEFSLMRMSWIGGASTLLNEAAMLNPAEVAYLLTADPRAWDLVRQIADSSGNYAVHYRVRDAQGGHWPRASETGNLPFLQGPDSVTIKTAAGVTCPIPDVAHLHSLAYLAALLTGDRYWREEAEAWASYALLAQKPDADRLRGLLWTGQVRGVAWGLRALFQTWAINNRYAPSQSVRLAAQLVENLIWMGKTFADPTSSPQYRPTGVTSVKPFRPAAMLQYVSAEPKPDYFATWNEEILGFVLGEIARAGLKEATPMRDHVLKVARGVWEHSPTIYDVGYGNHAYAPTWPEIMRRTFEGRVVKPTGFASPVTTDYVAWFRAPVVVAARLGEPWAVAALGRLDAEIAKWKPLPMVWRVRP